MDSQGSSERSIVLPIQRVSSSHSSGSRFECIFKCNPPKRDSRHPNRRVPSNRNLIRVPVEERVRVYSELDIFIPQRSVVCAEHLEEGRLSTQSWESLTSCIDNTESTLNSREIMELLRGMKKLNTKAQDYKPSFEQMTEDVVKRKTGRSKEEFELLRSISGLHSFTLGLFLEYVFSGHTQRDLATEYQISQGTISYHTKKAIEVLHSKLVVTSSIQVSCPLRPSREDLLEDSTAIAKTMFFP